MYRYWAKFASYVPSEHLKKRIGTRRQLWATWLSRHSSNYPRGIDSESWWLPELAELLLIRWLNSFWAQQKKKALSSDTQPVRHACSFGCTEEALSSWISAFCLCTEVSRNIMLLTQSPATGYVRSVDRGVSKNKSYPNIDINRVRGVPGILCLVSLSSNVFYR